VDDDKSLDDVDKQLTLLEQKAPDQQNQCEDPLDR
jgi:hypothetical protein